MGKEKYLKSIENLFKKSPVVSFDSIQRIVRDKKNIKQYTKQLVRNLILSKKIKRITKGFYSLYDDASLLVFCFKPAYLGLQDALSIHNLWEQETIPVVITSKKIRPGIRKVFNMNALIRRLEKKYVFGFDYIKQGDFYLPVSDIEKTFIDMIYFKEKINDETMGNMREKINKKKLNYYLKMYPKRFRKIVLGRL